MTQGDMLKEFLDDPIFQEKYELDNMKLSTVNFTSVSENKLIEIIKISIKATFEPEDVDIARRVNKFLNQQ